MFKPTVAFSARRPEEDTAARRFRRDLARRRRRNNHEAGASATPPAGNLLTEAEARELIRTNTPVPGNSRLPEGWETNPVHVPVAPRLTGQARVDYVTLCMQRMAREAHDDARFEPNSSYWDDEIEAEFQYRRKSFFADEAPSDWFDSDDDVLTNSSDEDFWAGVERDRERGVQPPPPQSEEDGGSGDISWPPTPEWDLGHMQRAIEADIDSAAATATSAATTSTGGYIYCVCSGCRRGPVLATARAGECPNCRCLACYPSN